MCIRICITSAPASTYRHYDADTNTITIPSGIPPERQEWALRLILAKMAVRQPARGAVCHCGAALRLLPRVPQQRQSEEKVMRRGA